MKIYFSIMFVVTVFKIRTICHANPDNKVHGANMGPTWVLSTPDGPHVGPMNLAFREDLENWLGLVNNCVYYAHQTGDI